MNAVEFMFALGAVFGSTAFWFAWISLVYNVEKHSDKDASQFKKNKKTTL